jgi:hypothetical protein
MNAINTKIKINIERELLFQSTAVIKDVDTIVQEKILGKNSDSEIFWDPISEYTLEEIDDEQYLVFEIRYETRRF